MNAGYYEEAEDWRNWLVRALAGAPDAAQILYGVAGERHQPEWELSWLPGYENSTTRARRKCGGRSVSARYLWRGGGCVSSRAARRHLLKRMPDGPFSER